MNPSEAYFGIGTQHTRVFPLIKDWDRCKIFAFVPQTRTSQDEANIDRWQLVSLLKEKDEYLQTSSNMRLVFMFNNLSGSFCQEKAEFRESLVIVTTWFKVQEKLKVGSFPEKVKETSLKPHTCLYLSACLGNIKRAGSTSGNNPSNKACRKVCPQYNCRIAFVTN